MTERPILFKDEMARAILDGRKTQTRRIINPQPLGQPTLAKIWHNNVWIWLSNSGKTVIFPPNSSCCPYGKVGDRLWVKEAWQHYHNCGQSIKNFSPDDRSVIHNFYRADESDPAAVPISGRWRNAMFMPRWASRITLEITDIRVQRVQDIIVDDAMAEGCKGTAFGPGPNGDEGILPSDQFRTLWDSINLKRGFDFSSNPWVWALTFKRI